MGEIDSTCFQILDREYQKSRSSKISKGVSSVFKCERTCTRKAMPLRTIKPLLVFTVLQFLLSFAHGQGPGNSITFNVSEEEQAGTLVGQINTQQGLTYRFNQNADQIPFSLNEVSGEITTSRVIDRETLQNDIFTLFVASYPEVNVIKVRIQVLDINDNRPIFGNSRIEVSFSERDTPGTQVILDTATDRDVGKNGVTNYRIISGNEESKFKIILQDTSKPLLYLENNVELDRETKQFYSLNISAQDGGDPINYGYLRVDITIRDYNDNNPVFDQSDYAITINETVPIGTSIIQVTATDLDEGNNGDIRYEVDEGKDQFWIDPDTGEIRTLKKLECYRRCDVTATDCKTKSCVVTIVARDNGHPYHTGRAYVTVTLIDENDHDPSIKFNKQTAKVEEGVSINFPVVLVTVTDSDDGENSNTSVRIAKGNERAHFKMDKASQTLFIIKVAAKLDREKVSKYNLTIQAKDNGDPPRSSSSHIVILVEDVNDHPPKFLQSSYSASLSESIPIGSFVAGITAMDNDTGANALLTYSIVSGNGLGWFWINPSTGLVTTKHLLDKEEKSSFSLVIKAQDNGATTFSTQANLSVKIDDENDEVPKFSQDIYYVNLTEESQPGPLPGLAVIAKDSDQGKNGTVTYQLHQYVNVKYPGIFKVNSNTGSISTLKVVDREVISTFKLILIAKDQGSPSLSSSATVIIKVRDINDHSPVFYPVSYFAKVLENQPPSTYVAKVIASDKDEGQNGMVRYTIYSGSGSRFQIDSNTGVITTTQTLTKNKYILKVKAEDLQGRQAADMANIEIFIVSSQDPMPVFSDSTSYTFIITETSNTNVSIGSVTASFQEKFSYFIVGGDPNGNFIVNQNTGEIKNGKDLDRETTAVYGLVVVAYANTGFTETIATVSIADINDNDPVFLLESTKIYFSENLPVGKSIVLAQADDSDYGNNSTLSYSFAKTSSDVFSIHTNSGLISLAKSISSDQENFQLTVLAEDLGTPSRSSTVDITLSVIDVNDHTPNFNKTNYELALLESLPVNERFFQLKADDLDEGINGEVTYEIISGNNDGNFGVFPDGVLYIAKPLDREKKNLFVLKIKAGNAGAVVRDTITNVTIHILDANDNDPVFTNETFHFTLLENSGIGTIVGKVSANDSDLGKNSELKYSLVGDHQGFTIAAESGVISSLSVFDREALMTETGSNNLTFSVKVTDNGDLNKRSSKATVIVSVTDTNDMVPDFSNKRYQATISESLEKGTSVFQMSASDSDIGQNSEIVYSIKSGNINDMFSIDSYAGNINLKGILDRETQDLYHLIVMAKDLGIHSLNSTTVLRIKIIDSNDNSPVFMDGSRIFNLSELTKPKFNVATFTATDKDLGRNGTVSYFITNGNSGSTFSIESRTGKLILALPLDYDEKTKVFDLQITARDNGKPSQNTTIPIRINVLDENDYIPTFTTAPIVREIKENVIIGTNVVTVSAKDIDSGDYGKVRYSIVKQVPSGNHFVINPDTALIETAAEIDREFSRQFKLTIRATDQAMPVSTRLYGEKVVQVLVTDTNDNPPVFISQKAALVTLNALANTVITKIEATDADEGLNAEILYTITSGNTNVFSLETTTGRLYLRSSLDPQTLSYDLTVKAQDKGSPQKSAFHSMTIFARLNNENGPIFTESGYSAQVRENEAVGNNVITVSARYNNGNPNTGIKYYITKVTANNMDMPRYFDIKNPRTGTITISQLLDREDGYEVYQVEVTAVDTATNQPSTRSIIVQVTVLDENDSPPVFSPDTIEVVVSEDKTPGDKVTTVTAIDADKEGSLLYDIVSGSDGKFSIDPAKGVLSIRFKLDRETKPKYMVKVSASDGVHISYATVMITVTDVNDEKPEFLKSFYYFDVPENTERGLSVGEVSAIDKDKGNNAQVTYSIQSHWGRQQFSLHPHTGVFTLIDNLDFEQVQQYILFVKAQDSGPNPKFSIVKVYMNVLDYNDNEPVFDHTSYSVQVWENATVGASVMQVTATDDDSAENSQIEYSVIGGDSQGVFSMDSQTGELRMARQLDRESQGFYNLVVEVVDKTPQPGTRLSSTALISVTVKDVNDNAPEFTTPSMITVKENSKPGSAIYTVTAIDHDEGLNGVVEYSLRTTAGGLFTIGIIDGVLKVEGNLDRETKDKYNIIVRATDKGTPPKFTDFPLTIQVGDDNDHSPVFSPKVYSKTLLKEDTPVGTSLLTLSATDRDSGINANIRYMIVSGDDTQSFYLDSNTGVFSINFPLDYECKQNYQITVMAYDLGVPQRSDTATVSIGLRDVNDCYPAFLNVPYNVYVQENVAAPIVMTQVEATDCDSGYNAVLSYSITEGSGNGLFSIDSQTGVLTVNKVLDREEVDTYEIVITATDTGSPRFSSSVSVVVLVSDANDHTPTFEHAHYRGIVMENIEAPVHIATVTAVDLDGPENGNIRYNLISDGNGQFTVDDVTGEITTTTKLDRESASQYQLIVKATDNGLLARSSTVDVSVTVQDDNDNSPRFLKNLYKVVIKDPTSEGSFITGVTAVDIDSGVNSKVQYSILSGTDSVNFNINPDTGIIKASKRLNSVDNNYQFTVRATDQGSKTTPDTATVSISFLSSVALSEFPSFTSVNQNLRLDETFSMLSPVATVRATSTKIGSVITYHIAGGNTKQTFQINQSGKITLKQKLDYEEVTKYNLWVEARDSSTSPPLSSYLGFDITVNDMNDSPPVFDQLYYNASVNEVDRPPVSVIAVTASDADSGNNGKITYELIGGNQDRHFNINATSGSIRTQVRLDREQISSYKLVVSATDHGVSQNTATATIDVSVADYNDLGPKFTRHFNSLIPENAPIGTQVLKITTTDGDIGANAVSTYKFVDNVDMFAINHITGWVTLTGQLDRENKATQYLLKVAASDGSHQQETSITIDVLDINDNAPVFSQVSYSFGVADGEAVGKTIGTVSAIDYDGRGLNSQVWYRMKYPQSEFSVDATSGEIKTLEVMKYTSPEAGYSEENIRKFHVNAFDRGDPVQSSEALVTVKITPPNEHAPIFEAASYTITVAENSPIKHTVGQLVAVDADTGDNGQIVYTSIDGNGTKYFHVDSVTGVLRVVGALTGLRSTSYSLKIKAEDKGIPPRSSTVNVTFKVIERNSYPPAFENAVYTASVDENREVGWKVIRVQASDMDKGVNGQVSYYITGGDDQGHFAINVNSGQITVNKKLDYETKKLYGLTVTAQDKGPLPKNTSKSCTISVIDVNDYPPTFQKTHYDAHINENLPERSFVYKANAVDLDANLAEVEYYITGDQQGMASFSIAKGSGDITTKQMLDYEVKSEYTVIVKAINPGTALSGTATVIVHVAGVNEYAPEFSKDVYYMDVQESAPSETVIGSVSATDLDKGIYGIVEYYLIEDSNLKGFSIDKFTGTIKVIQTIDREATSEIVLSVLAKNSGPIGEKELVDECTVQIQVGDANDPPRFTQPLYEKHIFENATLSSSVIQVTANDKDLNNANSQFSYSIENGNVGNAFRIHSNTGLITVAASLDRETVPLYTMIVAATDSGTPPKTGTTSVRVYVDDVNDNGPYFIPETPIGNLTENLAPRSEVAINLNEVTYDLDIGIDQKQVYRYKLLDHTSKFFVGQTNGLVQATVRLDREQVSDYLLKLLVTDNGNPTMTSTLTLQIKVLDVNDNPSTPRTFQVDVYAYLGEIGSGPIASVKPLDKDVVGDYQCQLRNPVTTFSIPTACDLHASSNVNFGQKYIIPIKGSDGKHSDVSYEASVTFKQFSQEMVDNSIVLKLANKPVSEFLSVYNDFKSTLITIIQDQGTVEIYSMVQTGNDLDLFIAPKQVNGKVLSRNALIQAIENNQSVIKSQTSCVIKNVNYNPCSDSPCKNGGECSGSVEVVNQFRSYDSNSFIFTSTRVRQKVKCTCTDEYTGPTCEEPINKCQQNPCKNQGTCSTNSDGTFKCSCTNEWEGSTCEQDVNECLPKSPCRNGGTCRNKPGSYQCDCLPSFTGKDCNVEVRSCSLKPCKNDGICKDNVKGRFTCQCKYGYRGETCEIDGKGFQPLSYLEYSRPLDQTRNTINIEFATVENNALLLLYSSQSTYEFLAVEIIQGQVRMSFSLGNEKLAVGSDIVRLTVPVMVSNGQWYSIVATRDNKVGSVKVISCPSGQPHCNDSECKDGDSRCHVQTEGGKYQVLDAADSSLYLGGIKDISTLTSHPNQVMSHDFVGCMRSVVVDGLDLFQLTPKQTNGTTDQCPRAAPQGVCTEGICGAQGVCVDQWNRHSCKCPKNKTGPTCSDDAKPISFGLNSVVQYSIKPTFKRNLLLSSPATSGRRKRALTSEYSFSLTFRTYASSGLMIHAESGTDYMRAYMTEGKISCRSSLSTVSIDQLVNDGEWYNLTIKQTGTDLVVQLDSVQTKGPAVSVPHGLWDVFTLGSGPQYTQITDDIEDFNGCVQNFLVNGETLPLSGYSDKYTIVSSGDITATCSGYLELAGKDGPPSQIVIIVICTLFAFILIGVLLAFVVIVYLRKKKEKKQQPSFQNGSAMFNKTNGSIISKTKTNNDSGRSHPDSGIADEENEFIHEHIQNELHTGGFQEREIRGSLNSNRPDIVAPDVLGDRNPDESDDGFENNGYSDGPPEHYDLDNASSIAPSDLLDYTQHYKRYRLGQLPAHNNKYKGGHKHMHHRHTPSPSILANRQSPASVSVQMGRQSPADMLGRMTPQKSQLTVENVNQLNRQTPVNQLSRASPAPNIPIGRDRMTSPLGPTSMRSTPLSGISGLYPSNISNSTSYSETSGVPNGHIRGGRPSSKLKQPINQVGLRNTPTKGLTIEEVNRLNARHTPPTTLDAISSSSEEDVKNNINQTEFTHSDLLEPSNSMLPPESSSEEETNDSFTCSEFEDDQKIRNDRVPARNFSRLPRVNEHDDTDTTLNSRGRNIETDSNRESHTSTFFTASEDDFPRKIGKTKFPNNLIGLDSLLNWGTNYNKLVGVFDDIAHLSQPDTPKKIVHNHSDSAASERSRPPSRASKNASPQPYLPPKPSRVASPGMRVMGQGPAAIHQRQIKSPLPPSPLVPKQGLLNGHVKQSSIISLASSHDRQSSISSVQSSRSGRPLANHHKQPSSSSSHLQVPNHSRSSSKSSLSSTTRQPSHNSMYNPLNPQPPPPPPSIAQAIQVVEGKANSPVPLPAREEYV